jgi:hypothetical protein
MKYDSAWGPKVFLVRSRATFIQFCRATGNINLELKYPKCAHHREGLDNNLVPPGYNKRCEAPPHHPGFWGEFWGKAVLIPYSRKLKRQSHCKTTTARRAAITHYSFADGHVLYPCYTPKP